MVNHDVSCETLYTYGHTGHNYQWIVFDQNRFGDTLVSDLNSASSDEIDLIELFTTFWEGKWKIIAAVITSLACVIGYEFLQPPANFKAETEIKPISSTEIDKYAATNDFGFYQVSSEVLLNLYIERLEDRKIFEKAITQFSLLDRNLFETEAEFNDAVALLSRDIELTRPKIEDEQNPSDRRRIWTINFEYNDEKKWKDVLSFVNSVSVAEVQKFLKDQFSNQFNIEKSKSEFLLEDIQTQISNAKLDYEKEMQEFELKQSFQLEDVQTQIDNAIKDYDRKTKDRIAFLKEQASIAKQLGVVKNTIEAQTFTTQNSIVANIKTDTPFYLRGYEAIEKEVELIENRADKLAFVPGLLELEQKKRALEQDLTLERAEKNKSFLQIVLDLEKKQRDIEQDKRLERAEQLFSQTPIMNDAEFTPVLIDVEATAIKYDSKSSLRLALVLAIGGFIGAAYVLIQGALAKRRSSDNANEGSERLKDIR